MSKPSDVVNIALAEVGYREKASNASLDDKTANAGSANWTKYARDLAAAGYYNGNKNGYAWCDVFVDWCFFKAYGAVEGQRIQCQSGPLGAGCIYSAQYYQQKGRYDRTPEGRRSGVLPVRWRDQPYRYRGRGKRFHHRDGRGQQLRSGEEEHL